MAELNLLDSNVIWRSIVKAEEMVFHEKYNFKNQPERLRYIGRNQSGTWFWHQFEKVGEVGVVWCELQDNDLILMEKSTQ